MIADLRMALALALALSGCAGQGAGASAPCEKDCLGLVTIGTERVTVGANEISMALVRHPAETQPGEAATSFRAIFTPEPAPAAFEPIEVDVKRNDAGPVLGTPGHRQMRFDYVAKVVFDRPGLWNMQVRVRAPWQRQEAVSVMQLRVVDGEHASAD